MTDPCDSSPDRQGHRRTGSTELATIVVDERAFMPWDEATLYWSTIAGENDLAIGASSRDLRTHLISPSP